MSKPTHINGIEVDQWILLCPYCGSDLPEEWAACCGEAGHGEETPIDCNGEIIHEDAIAPGKSDYTTYKEENKE